MWTLQRTPAIATTDSTIVAVTGDVAKAAADEAVLALLPTRMDHVVLSIAPSRTRGDTHESTYPSAARGAVMLAATLQARSILYTSSTGVYGRTDGSPVDEATPLLPTDERQRALVEAEEIVLGTAKEAGVGSIVLRIAGLYGPGRDPARRFLDPATTADGGLGWSNFAWRDDAASAVVHLLATPELEQGGHVFNCADGVPMQARDIAGALGVTVPRPSHLAGTSAGSSGRSNQRIVVDRLRASGWTPTVRDVLDGLEVLGHVVTRPSRRFDS